MRRHLPPHVYDKKGTLYFQRRGWPTKRIEFKPGSPEFAAEYARLLAGEKPIYSGPRSFAALITSYIGSARYRKLAPRTGRDYEKVLLWIRDKMGNMPVAGLQRKDVIRARDAQAHRMRFANYIVQVLRILMEHAIDLGWIAAGANPVAKVSLLQSQGEGRQAWPPEMIEAFRQAAPPQARLVFELCLGTGQRIGDVLAMRWDDIEGDGIRVTQSKTKAQLWVPFTAPLRAVLDQTPQIGPTICAWGVAGKPMRYEMASKLVRDVRAMIGAMTYDIHALRYAATAELAAAGCSDELIMAVTGHKTSAMVAKYGASARQRARAIEAQRRRGTE